MTAAEPGLPQVVSIRPDPDVLAALRQIAERRGITLSQLVREGMLAAAREPHVITWLIPPTVAGQNGTSVTIDARDLRSSAAPTPAQALAHIIAAQHFHEQEAVELTKARIALELLVMYGDADARVEAQDAAAAAVNARAGGAS